MSDDHLVDANKKVAELWAGRWWLSNGAMQTNPCGGYVLYRDYDALCSRLQEMTQNYESAVHGRQEFRTALSVARQDLIEVLSSRNAAVIDLYRKLDNKDVQLSEIRKELAAEQNEVVCLKQKVIETEASAASQIDAITQERDDNFIALQNTIAYAKQKIAAMTQERDEARELVARANNSLIGSYGYFTAPSFLDAIDTLKVHSNQQLAELASQVQRAPTETETVCGACGGCGWVERGY